MLVQDLGPRLTSISISTTLSGAAKPFKYGLLNYYTVAIVEVSTPEDGGAYRLAGRWELDTNTLFPSFAFILMSDAPRSEENI